MQMLGSDVMCRESQCHIESFSSSHPHNRENNIASLEKQNWPKDYATFYNEKQPDMLCKNEAREDIQAGRDRPQRNIIFPLIYPL